MFSNLNQTAHGSGLYINTRSATNTPINHAYSQDMIPSGVVPLEYYVVNIKYMERKFSFLLKLAFDGFKDMTSQYKLQAETKDLLETWVEKIKKQV
jgi:hypothetical protein